MTPASSAPASDPLLSLLPQLSDASRPWLVWYSPSERVELTGHVLAMWAAKIAGFLSSEAPATPLVHLDVHGWRLLAWCAGTWLAGGCILLPDRADMGSGQAAVADEPSVSVACREEDLWDTDIQLLLPYSSLALHWDGGLPTPSGTKPGQAPLPPLAYDGIADVMTYPDYFAPQAVSEQAPAFAGTLNLSRGDLAERCRDLALSASSPRGARHLIQTNTSDDVGTAIVQVLQTWARRQCAIMVSDDASIDLLADIRRQEGLTEAG